jgi:guanine deaminase
MSELDRKFLEWATQLAATSKEPVGCAAVIVRKGKVLAEAVNSQWTDNCAVYHAEIKAIMVANKAVGARTLPGAVAYCSCEPCMMCLAALSYARVERIVFAKRMIDLNPGDRQSQLYDPQALVEKLSFQPKLEQLIIT